MQGKTDTLEYPKTYRLKDGSTVELRLMSKDDYEALLEFFRSLPEEDRMFLKEDVTRPEVIKAWVDRLDYDTVLPILAFAGSRLVGDATLHMQKYGWMRHVGEIRLVVAREYQGKGLGTLLARELFHNAVRRGLAKIEALVMEDQIGAIKALQRLGFKKEGVLKDYVLDLKDNTHNLIVLTHNTEELWRKMEDMIIDGDLFLEHH